MKIGSPIYCRSGGITMSMRIDQYRSIDKHLITKINKVIGNNNEVVNGIEGLVLNILFELEHHYYLKNENWKPN